MTNMTNIIHNPNAHGQANTQTSLVPLLEVLIKHQSPYVIHETHAPSHATSLTRELYEQGARTFVVSGGDGTLYEVINGIGPETTLGIVPVGTGNDVAKTFGITPKNAPQVITQGRSVKADYGLINHELKFMSLVSFGVVTDILQMLASFKSSSKWNYAKSLLKRTIAFKAKEYEVIMNGTSHFYQADFLSVHNCKYAGGGMKLCPPANPTDGYLDLIVVQYQGLYRRFCNLLSVITGTLDKQPNVITQRITSLTLISREDPLCCIDGELASLTHLEINVVKGGVSILQNL